MHDDFRDPDEFDPDDELEDEYERFGWDDPDEDHEWDDDDFDEEDEWD